MPKTNQAQFKWNEGASHRRLLGVMDQLRTETPAPIIKINIGVKDIPHASLEALLEFFAEHEIEPSVTLTATRGDGWQMAFWDRNQARLPDAC